MEMEGIRGKFTSVRVDRIIPIYPETSSQAAKKQLKKKFAEWGIPHAAFSARTRPRTGYILLAVRLFGLLSL